MRNTKFELMVTQAKQKVSSPKVLKTSVIVLLVMVVILVSALICSGYEPNYAKMADNLEVVQVLNSDEITDQIMIDSHKAGTIVIERKISRCINAKEGIGLDIYTDENVDLSGVGDLTKGAVVASYYVYNPDGESIDETLGVFNYILDR